MRGATSFAARSPQSFQISIHAPRAGSDFDNCIFAGLFSGFQSTLPVRGATKSRKGLFPHTGISIHAPRAGSDDLRFYCLAPLIPISIHAPRAGSDSAVPLCQSMALYFNPRSPCGERRAGIRFWQIDGDISIHAPRAGSDYKQWDKVTKHVISIHAPRAGSDYIGAECVHCIRHFNPRSPCGERPWTMQR